MFTKRLSCAGALKSRVSMPAALVLRSLSTSPTVAPWASTTSAPLVKVRRGEGMRTLIAMGIRERNKRIKVVKSYRGLDAASNGSPKYYSDGLNAGGNKPV